jgi:cyclohexadieny/prephenate dehydrogenase
VFNRVALIGMGLIGSSIARAARAQGAAGSIVATARSAATRRRIANSGSPTRSSKPMPPPPKAPISSSFRFRWARAAGCCAEIGPHLAPGAVVSDVGSVKGAVVKDMSPHIPAGVHFVPAHPVAGTENSGPDAGFAELFVNRWCILTPPPTSIRPRWNDWRRSGGCSAPMWRPCRPNTTISCSASPATCRISSPTPSSGPPMS